MTEPAGHRARIDASGVGTSQGDYKVGELSQCVDTYLTDVARESATLARDRRKWIAFTPSVDNAETLATLRGIAVALLSDNLHRNVGSVGLQPYHRSSAIMAGTAVTVRSRGGDNLTMLRAYEYCRPGDVMVIACGGDVTNAVLGGILSYYGATIGLSGMVVDGAIRDVAEIREHRRHLGAEAGEADVPFPGDPDDGTAKVPETAAKILLAAEGPDLEGGGDGFAAWLKGSLPGAEVG